MRARRRFTTTRRRHATAAISAAITAPATIATVVHDEPLDDPVPVDAGFAGPVARRTAEVVVGVVVVEVGAEVETTAAAPGAHRAFEPARFVISLIRTGGSVVP